MFWDFVSILVMLNNYFHDFATAMIGLLTYVMWIALGRAEADGSVLIKVKAVALYPRLMHASGITLMLLLMAGIVRSFTYKWFEWVGVLGMSQIVVLIIKHVVMFGVTGFGIYVWAVMYKKIKAMRNEI